jgi:hypothetical protein
MFCSQRAPQIVFASVIVPSMHHCINVEGETLNTLNKLTGVQMLHA